MKSYYDADWYSTCCDAPPIEESLSHEGEMYDLAAPYAVGNPNETGQVELRTGRCSSCLDPAGFYHDDGHTEADHAANAADDAYSDGFRFRHHAGESLPRAW